MRSPIRLFFLLLLAISQTGYAQHASSQTATAPPKVNPVTRLRKDLNRIISDASLARAQLGIEILSLDRTDILYEKNAQQLLTPASSNKIITAAVALMKLGAGYRFETRVLTDGQVENGVLKGNLIVRGSGDPTYSSKFNDGDPFNTFHTWAANLKERNIRAISGSILGDEGTFGESALGQGWEWNDLSHAFAAPVGALQFNDNMATIAIAPGSAPGNPALIRPSPLEGYFKISNRVITGQEKSQAEIGIRNGEPRETIDIWGTIPSKGEIIQQTVAIRYPALFFLSALRHILSSEGIAVENIGLAEKVANPGDLSQLWIHSSPELSEIIKPLLKNSLNLYAETLVRALGMNFREEGSFAKGKEIIEETLAQMGIETGTYSYTDGSGLSRLNLESADSFVRLLKFMHRDKFFRFFYDALPIAGVDGTLASRLKRTRAEGNVHAKTGSLANVSSISGYVKTIDGEMLAFSIGVNGHIGSRNAVESMQDKVLIRLANFSRKTSRQSAVGSSQKSGIRNQESGIRGHL